MPSETMPGIAALYPLHRARGRVAMAHCRSSTGPATAWSIRARSSATTRPRLELIGQSSHARQAGDPRLVKFHDRAAQAILEQECRRDRPVERVFSSRSNRPASTSFRPAVEKLLNLIPDRSFRQADIDFINDRDRAPNIEQARDLIVFHYAGKRTPRQAMLASNAREARYRTGCATGSSCTTAMAGSSGPRTSCSVR